jgi:hypothetical protein
MAPSESHRLTGKGSHLANFNLQLISVEASHPCARPGSPAQGRGTERHCIVAESIGWEPLRSITSPLIVQPGA